MEPSFKVNGIFPAYLAIGEGFNPEEIKENFAYVLDGAGWKLFKRNGVTIALIPVQTVQGLVALEQDIKFTAKKLPLEMVRQVTAWFKQVYQKFHSEAVGDLYYQRSSGQWDFVPPVQTATGASASYEAAPKREGWQVVGTIHSHGSMSAFHSGVDDKDETFFDGVHITVGKVDSVPEYSCSIVVQGVREKLDPAIVIDGMAPADAIPAIWLTVMKLPAPELTELLFQARADALYQEYYSGKISESDYKKILKEIEEEEKAQILASTTRQAFEKEKEMGDEEEERKNKKKSRKGGKHGK